MCFLAALFNCNFNSGGWSTKGVTTKGYNRNRSVVHCTSSHLTSFAILVGASGTDVSMVDDFKFIIYKPYFPGRSTFIY